MDEEVERVMHKYDQRYRSNTTAQRRCDRHREAQLAVQPRIQQYYTFGAWRYLASRGRFTPHVSRRVAPMMIQGCGTALRFQGALEQGVNSSTPPPFPSKRGSISGKVFDPQIAARACGRALRHRQRPNWVFDSKHSMFMNS